LSVLQRKGKETNTHARNNKINEEKQNRKTQMETCSVTTREKNTCEAESFRNMKVKISYTLEDGHVGRNMQ
jgi:hypothetical protein